MHFNINILKCVFMPSLVCRPVLKQNNFTYYYYIHTHTHVHTQQQEKKIFERRHVENLQSTKMTFFGDPVIKLNLLIPMQESQLLNIQGFSEPVKLNKPVIILNYIIIYNFINCLLIILLNKLY